QDYAPYLSNVFVMADFIYHQALSGQKEIQPRYKRMIQLTDKSIGEMSGKFYVDKYFSSEAKEKMMQLINNLQQTFAERINQLSWMSDSTKQQAQNKLNLLTKKIAYPDTFNTYEGLVITDNLVQNIKNVNQWKYLDNLKKLGKPINKIEWRMTSPTVNAYYSPLKNEIAFPAGILQFPFFDFSADDAINYGGIVAVIGHEIIHGFDDKGSQFDALGNLRNWWTFADRKLFDSLAQLVVNQYNNFTVLDTIHVNGKLCLGENIADLGGLMIAYEAFKKTPQGQSDKKIDGFTPDQRFFLSFAQVWRQNILPETQARFILVDPHSPSQYRCNGPVVHMQAFYDAFDINPDQKMYLPVEKRIKIW
ncbi:MAG: M13-type metalloendopeptidase, partial [Chitinophagaceae bacterium]